MGASYLYALLGGALIGLSSAGMLLANGRILGISGIVGGAISPQSTDKGWRWMFLTGLVAGSFFIEPLGFSVMQLSIPREWWHMAIGGLLVGFGTTVGNGCTSGHGVCGVSRLSPRSLLATLIFVLMGMVAVGVLDHLLWVEDDSSVY